ncbi:MAG: ABC transporter, permease protein (cluster 3, basic aa/glutamine/opines), partial [uncultured Nocardioidaceae bacterium]
VDRHQLHPHRRAPCPPDPSAEAPAEPRRAVRALRRGGRRRRAGRRLADAAAELRPHRDRGGDVPRGPDGGAEEHRHLHLERLHRRSGARRAARADAAVVRAAVPLARDGVHRGVPRPARPAHLPVRRRRGAAGLSRLHHPRRHGRPGGARPHPGGGGVHGRDGARRHPGGPEGADGSRTFAGHVEHVGPDQHRHSAGVPHHRPAADERAGAAVQGQLARAVPRRAARRPRAHEVRPRPGQHQGEHHPDPHRRPVLPRHHHSAQLPGPAPRGPQREGDGM